MDYGELEGELASLGAQLLLKTIGALKNGLLKPIRQDHEKATYAHRLQREDESINWNLDAKTIHNQVRALCPLPGAYTEFQGEPVKIYRTRIVNNEEIGNAGQILAVTKTGLLVQTGQGLLEILEMQKPGRKRMKALDCWQGLRLNPGIILPN